MHLTPSADRRCALPLLCYCTTNLSLRRLIFLVSARVEPDVNLDDADGRLRESCLLADPSPARRYQYPYTRRPLIVEPLHSTLFAIKVFLILQRRQNACSFAYCRVGRVRVSASADCLSTFLMLNYKSVTDLLPIDTEENPFYYTFKVQCTSCREIHPNWVSVSRFVCPLSRRRLLLRFH